MSDEGVRGAQVNGTASVVADDYLVTNAHVVAGSSDDPGRGAVRDRRRDGRPVRPRPRRRAALRPGPRRARRSASPRRTRSGARSGRRSATRAAARWSCCRPAVTGGYAADGRDIYDEDVVTARHPRAARRGRAGRLGRAARARERDDRRARVRGVARGRVGRLRADADERRRPHRAPRSAGPAASTSASACADPHRARPGHQAGGVAGLARACVVAPAHRLAHECRQPDTRGWFQPGNRPIAWPAWSG